MEAKALMVPRVSRGKAFLFAVIMVCVAFASATVLRGIFSSPETYQSAYDTLNEKRDNVMVLTAAATTASASLSLMPSDAGSSLADQLMVIAKDFSLVLAAIVLEKYLLTMMGGAFFGLVVPICCLLVAATGFLNRANPSRLMWRQAALKFFALGLIFFLATPLSVMMASSIDETYQVSTAVQAIEDQGSDIEENANAASEAAETSASKEEEKKPGGALGLLGQGVSAVTSTVGDAVKGATDAALGALDYARTMIANLIELFGVMLVTSIVIPIIAPIVMYLAFKALFGQQLPAAPQVVAAAPAQLTEETVRRMLAEAIPQVNAPAAVPAAEPEAAPAADEQE